MIFKQTNKINVKVLKQQEHQISSSEKIEKALKKDNVIAFDIFNENNLIGFAMLREFAKGKFFLWNYAIDYKFQNKGYGTLALKQLIEFLKQNYNCTMLTTTYTFGNNHAKHIYEKVGFKQTDIVCEEDVHEVNMQLMV